VSGWTDAWDPRVRLDRRVGPACQSGPARQVRPPVGPACQVRPWDPRVRSDRRVGPACQVGPTRGTRVSGRTDRGTRVSGRTARGTRVLGQTDAWDPRVKWDRRVGPVCQVGLMKFKCMTDGSYTPRKKNGSYTSHKKNDTWILHIGVNIHIDDTLAKPLRWQSNHFKYMLN
jgi:hypothetical protein